MALDMNNFSSDMTEKQAIRSDKKLRIGIIGTGGIAHSHPRTSIIPTLRSSPRAI